MHIIDMHASLTINCRLTFKNLYSGWSDIQMFQIYDKVSECVTWQNNKKRCERNKSDDGCQDVMKMNSKEHYFIIWQTVLKD